MKNLINSLVIVGLATFAAGCEKKASDTATKPTGGTQSSSTSTEAPKTDKPVAAPASTATQATADGAMQLFVDSIKKGDFTTAATVCDPASEGFKEVNEIASAIEIARAKDSDGKGDPVTPMILNFFAKPYSGATFKKVTEQDVRARYELLLTGATQPMPIDLSLVNAKWYLIAPKGILNGDKSTLPAVQQPELPPPPATEPTPAPAPAPAPAEGAAPQN